MVAALMEISAPACPAMPEPVGRVFSLSAAEGSLFQEALEGPGPDFPALVTKSGHSGAGKQGSLNSDPFNVRAEEMALDDCIGGREVRRLWSEEELVRCFDGRLIPGTPDGMFEIWDPGGCGEGDLYCVQVVRVPLLPCMSVADQSHALAQTIIAKVVKSQHWLRATQVTPQEFIIFGWLPFAVSGEVLRHGQELIERVQKVDSRFTLKLRTPAEASELFPSLFACCSVRKSPSFSESDISSEESLYDGPFDDDEPLEWDITWDWTGDSV